MEFRRTISELPSWYSNGEEFGQAKFMVAMRSCAGFSSIIFYYTFIVWENQ
jgi:hypothetical protein